MQAEHIDMDRLIAGLGSKSEKIRELGRHGVPTAEIARYLDIRYQHARNVLKEAGLHKVAKDSPAASPKPYAWVELKADGSLTIPAELLAAAGIAPGLPVHVRLTGDGIEVFSQHAALARAQAIAAPYRRPGVSEVDEFIAERRREAAREDRGE
jgi:hypothetical protein